MVRTHLLIIDPQNDFCDPERGSLFVPGADEDMRRLSTMLTKLSDHIDKITVTLDSHHPVDIAHPIFWRESNGKPPAPFTHITLEDVVANRVVPALPNSYARALEYLEALEDAGRYTHTIWPPHCLIGSHGHNVDPVLFAALQQWSERRLKTVDFVSKGANPWTEHFSAIEAEVPDHRDPDTQLNRELILSLEASSLLLVAGEAGSHCVANTIRDAVQQFDDPGHVKRIVLLQDAISPVTGFERFQEEFIADLTAQGMQLSTTTEILSRFL